MPERMELVATVCDPFQGLMTRTHRLRDQLQKRGFEVEILRDPHRFGRTAMNHVHVVDVARRIEENLAFPQGPYSAGFSRMVALPGDALLRKRLQEALRRARAILASNLKLAAFAKDAAPQVPLFWVRDGWAPFSLSASQEIADRTRILSALYEHRLLFAGTLRAKEPLLRFARLIAMLRRSGARVQGIVAGPLETPAAVANLRSLSHDLIDYVGAWDRDDIPVLIRACDATVQVEDGWSLSALAHEAARIGAPLLLERSVACLATGSEMAEALLQTDRICHTQPILALCKQALDALSDEPLGEAFGFFNQGEVMRFSQMDEVNALISLCDLTLS